MQTGRHCPHCEEVMFVSAHKRSCNLLINISFWYRVRLNTVCVEWEWVCLCLCAPQIKTCWHTHWDGTKPSLQQRTEPQRGRSLQCLLVFPPADPHGYRHSPAQGSHRETGWKPERERQSKSDSEHIFDCSQKADPTSPPPSLNCIPQLATVWLQSLSLEAKQYSSSV